MRKNIELNRGIIYSQKLLVKLMAKGLSRLDAYDIVQTVSLEVINDNSSFKQKALQNKQIKKYLSRKELEEIFDPYSYLANIDKIYKRFALS